MRLANLTCGSQGYAGTYIAKRGLAIISNFLRKLAHRLCKDRCSSASRRKRLLSAILVPEISAFYLRIAVIAPRLLVCSSLKLRVAHFAVVMLRHHELQKRKKETER